MQDWEAPPPSKLKVSQEFCRAIWTRVERHRGPAAHPCRLIETEHLSAPDHKPNRSDQVPLASKGGQICPGRPASPPLRDHARACRLSVGGVFHGGSRPTRLILQSGMRSRTLASQSCGSMPLSQVASIRVQARAGFAACALSRPVSARRAAAWRNGVRLRFNGQSDLHCGGLESGVTLQLRLRRDLHLPIFREPPSFPAHPHSSVRRWNTP